MGPLRSFNENGDLPSELRTCARCGSLARRAARFCDTCGLELDHPSPFESELKYVTVLFGDVVNSTELIAGLGPEEAKAVLTPPVNAMVAAVQAFGGTVHSVLGDGVLALFGAPVSQEDHALRACQAALRMHQAAYGLGGGMRLRVGLASGTTLYSSHGGTAPGDLSAFGATIHMASRLQSLAEPGGTLCADSTRALAGPQVELRALGPMALRGFGLKQEVFALAGLRAARRFSGALLSAFAGRQAELEALLGHAAAAADGAAGSIAIVAEAGAGKSRLAWELARRLEADGWAVIQAGAASYGREAPFQLVAGLLRACFGLDGAAGGEAAAAGLMEALARLEAAEVHAPALLSLLGLPLGEAGRRWEALDPFRRRDATNDAVRAVLEAVPARRPTLVLVDDLQWADEESLKALDFAPLGTSLLVATHRPDFSPAWRDRTVTCLQLAPLGAESLGTLIDGAFPALEPAMRSALIERADGNPFFLEELARDASPGAGPDAAALPPTIQAVLAARIDRLAGPDKQMALTAAALGTRFPLRHLRSLFDDQLEPAFRRQLAALSDAGILRPVQPADADVAFAHALVQEVGYSVLPRSQRRELHRLIAQRLGAAGAEPETLAHHAAAGEAWAELVPAARAAGRRAARQSAYIAAARFLRQAIDACRKLPRTAEALAEEIDLRFELRVALFPTEGIEYSLTNSQEAEALARELGDRRRLGQATAELARSLQLVGRPREAVAMARRALDHAAEDPELAMAARYFAAQAGFSLGDYRAAAESLHDMVWTLERTDPGAWTGTTGPAIIIFRAWLIWSLARLGRFDEALGEAARMLELAEAVDLPLGKTLAHLSRGYALAHADRLEEAEAALREALALCRRWALYAWSTNIMSCLGHVLSRLGQTEAGLDFLGQAIERTLRIQILVNHAQELAWLAEAQLQAGQTQAALRTAEQAVAVARRHEERGNEAMAQLVLAQAWRALGAQATAREEYLAALALARAAGMAAVAARCEAALEEWESKTDAD